jgi:hypothetical protein
MAPYNIPKEEEIQEYAVSWKNHGQNLLGWEGCVLLNFLPRDNSDSNHCIETLRSRIRTFVEFNLQEKCLKCCSSMIILVCTTEAITGWTLLVHQPYSPHLELSDCHLFGLQRKILWGHHYANDEAPQIALCQ